MSFTNRVNRTLHDEHGATVALMERLEQLFARHRRGSPPEANEPSVRQLLADLLSGVGGEIERHFAFEEEHLFRFLKAIGDEAIGAHLTDEHGVIRPLIARITALAREAMAQGFNQASWDEFRSRGQELCERLLAHVQKEEMALLPLLEANMDADTEARLFQQYAATA